MLGEGRGNASLVMPAYVVEWGYASLVQRQEHDASAGRWCSGDAMPVARCGLPAPATGQRPVAVVAGPASGLS